MLAIWVWFVGVWYNLRVHFDGDADGRMAGWIHGCKGCPDFIVHSFADGSRLILMKRQGKMICARVGSNCSLTSEQLLKLHYMQIVRMFATDFDLSYQAEWGMTTHLTPSLDGPIEMMVVSLKNSPDVYVLCDGTVWADGLVRRLGKVKVAPDAFMSAKEALIWAEKCQALHEMAGYLDKPLVIQAPIVHSANSNLRVTA